jgi:hypothetical protein
MPVASNLSVISTNHAMRRVTKLLRRNTSMLMSTVRILVPGRCQQNAQCIWSSSVTHMRIVGWVSLSNLSPSSRLRHYTASLEVANSIPDEVIGLFSKCPITLRPTKALGSTQSLTNMNARHLRDGKGRSPRKTDDLTAICEPNVYFCVVSYCSTTATE